MVSNVPDDPNLLQKVIQLVRDGKTREQIKAVLGISMWKTRQLIAQARVIIEGPGCENVLSDQKLVLELKRPRTIDDLARRFGVEREDVEVAIDNLAETGFAVSRQGDTVELGKSEEHVKLDAKMSKMQQQYSTLNRRYRTLLDQLSEKDAKIETVVQLAAMVAGSDPVKLKVEDSGKPSQSTAFMVASDWHLEEEVDPVAVNGLNKYNLEIAEQRISKFFQNGLKLVEMCRAKSNIDTLVLALLGDLISGYIHDELVESNQLSPVQAIHRLYQLLSGGIDFLLENGGFEQLIIPTCCGNHGRTTPKPRVSTAIQNSYEWLLYKFLCDRYAGDSRVQFNVAAAYFTYLDCYGKTIRFHHGDDIRYQGGIGGVHIPLNKAIGAWNKAKRADLDVLGHWHARMSHGNYVVNGSMIGYNAFSIRIKADYEVPCQSFFLMHPTRGKTVECPIHVE